MQHRSRHSLPQGKGRHCSEPPSPLPASAGAARYLAHAGSVRKVRSFSRLIFRCGTLLLKLMNTMRAITKYHGQADLLCTLNEVWIAVMLSGIDSCSGCLKLPTAACPHTLAQCICCSVSATCAGQWIISSAGRRVCVCVYAHCKHCKAGKSPALSILAH